MATKPPEPVKQQLGVPRVAGIAAIKPTRWEYMIIPLQSNATANLDALNRAGAAGWELVQVERLEYLMKRRVA